MSRIAINDHFDAMKKQKQTQVQPPSLYFDIVLYYRLL